MTPKEKAEELFHKYADEFNFDDTYRGYREQSKQCALMSVDEIIKALVEYDNRNNTYELQNMDRDFNYWEQVRIEIENL